MRLGFCSWLPGGGLPLLLQWAGCSHCTGFSSSHFFRETPLSSPNHSCLGDPWIPALFTLDLSPSLFLPWHSSKSERVLFMIGWVGCSLCLLLGEKPVGGAGPVCLSWRRVDTPQVFAGLMSLRNACKAPIKWDSHSSCQGGNCVKPS